MSLDRDEIEKIAHLARIALREEDVPLYLENLADILGLVERMNAVDTTGVEPMAHPLDTSQHLRPDRVTEDDRREQLQANAPLTEAGLFLVPRTVE